MAGASTFVDVLGQRAAASAGLAFEFVDRNGSALSSIGYPELDERARTIGAALAERGLTGQRVLVLLPLGAEYVTALLGCFYAGAVAVPLPPLDLDGLSARHLAVLDDADPAAAIVPPWAPAGRLAAAGLDVLSTVEFVGGPDTWRRPEIGPDSLAFLQYAPGAAEPGVMVSHANLIASTSQLQRHFGASEDTGVVSWLPPYHGMGLIAGILAPILTGSRATLLPSSAPPATWLRMISERQARISGGPDSAYERCLDDELTGLDLSRWDVAFTDGAANPTTTERFATRMVGFGFRRSAFFPCYWLPEATSLIAGRPSAVVTRFDTDTVAPGRLAKPAADGVPLLDRGVPVADLDIAIVDPLTATRCPEGTAGEVWVSGPNVAVGYLGRPEVSERTFCARLRGSTENYLRTGELGFVHNGGLHLAQPQEMLVA